jgi:hypothetical protein
MNLLCLTVYSQYSWQRQRFQWFSKVSKNHLILLGERRPGERWGMWTGSSMGLIMLGNKQIFLYALAAAVTCCTSQVRFAFMKSARTLEGSCSLISCSRLELRRLAVAFSYSICRHCCRCCARSPSARPASLGATGTRRCGTSTFTAGAGSSLSGTAGGRRRRSCSPSNCSWLRPQPLRVVDATAGGSGGSGELLGGASGPCCVGRGAAVAAVAAAAASGAGCGGGWWKHRPRAYFWLRRRHLLLGEAEGGGFILTASHVATIAAIYCSSLPHNH